MSNTTPQERLELKEFVLDANLHLIKYSLLIVTATATNIYYGIYMLYTNKRIELLLFITLSIIFIFLLIFAISGFKSIKKQKELIARLDSVFEYKERVSAESLSDEKISLNEKRIGKDDV